MSQIRVNNITNAGGTGPAYQPGSVVQVVSAHSGFVNQTIVSTTPVALTGMSVSITPKFASSKLIVQAMLVASYTYVTGVHIYRDGVDVIPAHGGNNQSSGTTSLWTYYQASTESDRDNQVLSMPIIYHLSAGTTSTTTIDIRANSGWNGGTETFRFNNRDASDMLSSSFLTVWEVAQ